MRQAQLGADTCTPSCGHPHTSNTLTTTSLSPSPPLASPVESRVYESRPTYSARQVNSVASTSSQWYYSYPHTGYYSYPSGRMRRHLKVPSTTLPTLLHLQHDFLDCHLSALMPLRHGRKSPESADRTYHHRKCRTCAVRSTSGAQRTETEAPARSTSYSAATIEGNFLVDPAIWVGRDLNTGGHWVVPITVGFRKPFSHVLKGPRQARM